MDLDRFKKMLEAEEVRLSNEVAFIESEDPYKDANRVREVQDDTITEIEEHDRLKATQSQFSSELLEVKKALVRLEKGTFGLCQNCQQPIDEDRLEIMPSAVLCASCQASKKRA